MTLAKQIPKLLIANRGEIALRIIATCRKLKIQSVAIFHEIEAEAPYVLGADESYEIVGDTPAAAYLDSMQIIQIAKISGAAAIHPGYGFLAENGDFAAAVAEASLIFIGPTPAAIRLLGDKVAARDFAARHDIPLAPSVSDGSGAADLIEKAKAIGFPLLIKAAAGGGGRGMHIVNHEDEFETALGLARSEAERYFGNSSIYCEKYIARPRHIEVQILADEHGNCIHLGERECSIQRRFQKVFEEAPASRLSPELRERICTTAVEIACAANYTNAGTVEFILAEDGAFYFLEMNTRLQVEHPVTEMVTGVDIVEMQLSIAVGNALPLTQQEVRWTGHAIEMRICAEDPEAEFIPATGRVSLLRNASGDGVRLDSGLAAGMRVTTAFDPMLAKLIVHGPDRACAIAKAAIAVREQVILGVTTNCGFLARVLTHPAFVSGDIHTHFIDDYRDELRRLEPDAALRTSVLAIAAFNEEDFRRLTFDTPQPHAAMGAWRNT
jgi:acetyl/propionyl-CoA carboxylase alpha subunit